MDAEREEAQCTLDEQEPAELQPKPGAVTEDMSANSHDRARVLWPQEDLYDTIVQVQPCPHGNIPMAVAISRSASHG